ncbi:MAG: 6-carboxytetrahydropterin synthase QueD [Candidatus Margulisiibacteriota bacterium]
MFELTVDASFDAAHALRKYKGQCENLHGHTWKVQISLKGKKLNHLGLMVDFREIKAKLSAVVEQLDHTNLNNLAPFKKINPSSENVAQWIYGQLKRKLPQLCKVSVSETPGSLASYLP